MNLVIVESAQSEEMEQESFKAAIHAVAQALSNALHKNVAGISFLLTLTGDPVLSNPVDTENHLSSWCRLTQANFQWLATQGMEMCKIYSRLYGEIHPNQSVIEYCGNFSYAMPDGEFTDPSSCAII